MAPFPAAFMYPRAGILNQWEAAQDSVSTVSGTVMVVRIPWPRESRTLERGGPMSDKGAGACGGPITIRLFGLLRIERHREGLPTELTLEIEDDGVTARELAGLIGIDPERIEGVFVNHVMYGLSRMVMPGDRVAYVPYGTPGPHRVYLGIYEAGQDAGVECSDEPPLT